MDVIIGLICAIIAIILLLFQLVMTIKCIIQEKTHVIYDRKVARQIGYNNCDIENIEGS